MYLNNQDIIICEINVLLSDFEKYWRLFFFTADIWHYCQISTLPPTEKASLRTEAHNICFLSFCGQVASDLKDVKWLLLQGLRLIRTNKMCCQLFCSCKAVKKEEWGWLESLLTSPRAVEGDSSRTTIYLGERPEAFVCSSMIMLYCLEVRGEQQHSTDYQMMCMFIV